MVLHNRFKRRRKGFINTVELLFIVPIIMVLILAMIYFSSILTVQVWLNNAAHLAAREVTTGGSKEDVRAVVRKALGEARAKRAEVHFEPEFSPDNPIPPGQPVEVVVRIKTRNAVPNLLSFIGFKIGNRYLIGREVMRME